MTELPPSPILSPAPCPLNHGVSVVDQLLAAITREVEIDLDALNHALDFRLLLATSDDADAILRDFFSLRARVETHHYLPCYRLRRWLQTRFLAQVRLDRNQPVRAIPLNLEAKNFRELCARCAFDAADGGSVTPWVRISFAWARDQAAVSN